MPPPVLWNVPDGYRSYITLVTFHFILSGSRSVHQLTCSEISPAGSCISADPAQEDSGWIHAFHVSDIRRRTADGQTDMGVERD